ncbi:ASCH domain-containing protein [Sphingobacterium daejeonense]|uniref:ASCH domain-containing protein n=1 Tax=Sphingobacterium daejeonense TaxID=371142 RepID=UPI0010C4E96E|nr:ASCH domain-containing protein [Sphingobacterium daejeonense]VTP94927.1 Uncharacterised protein [Sphingobacterium daejeonense]
MILGFKQQFVEPILKGNKIHTIREDSKDRWKTGSHIHMATGVRTKSYSCFNEVDVKGVQYIFMTNHRWTFEVSIGDTHYCDKYLYPNDIEKIAINDGFKSLEDFQKWFIPLIESSPEHCFSGKIIHWTDFKY